MNYLVFLGSARASAPPNPERLGLRVARAVVAQISQAENHVELIDPLDLHFDAIFKPHFSYAKAKAPADIDALAEKINRADGLVMISPEYNHSMSPALSHILNHFASSLFAYKPSAIVTYSAGQWGGARAAVGMRTFLSELGCLPVSAMIHIPKAQEVLDERGEFFTGVDGDKWRKYFARTLSQLEWWALAAQAMKAKKDPFLESPAFMRHPSQRNAP